MESPLIVIDGFRAGRRDTTDLREEAWSFALDQRAFGPRRLLVNWRTDDQDIKRTLAAITRAHNHAATTGPAPRI